MIVELFYNDRARSVVGDTEEVVTWKLRPLLGSVV